MYTCECYQIVIICKFRSTATLAVSDPIEFKLYKKVWNSATCMLEMHMLQRTGTTTWLTPFTLYHWQLHCLLGFAFIFLFILLRQGKIGHLLILLLLSVGFFMLSQPPFGLADLTTHGTHMASVNIYWCWYWAARVCRFQIFVSVLK